MAATIGVRLSQNIRQNFGYDIGIYYWTDSTTVLSWIRRNNQWKPFIWNRIEEIKKYSKPESWFFVPGEINPADLPSRGCSAKKLVEGKWWEGPRWLYNQNKWPSQDFSYNDDEINKEKRKIVVSSLLATEEDNFLWYQHASKFSKIVVLIGWMKRFIHNCRTRGNNKEEFGKKMYLTVSEIKDAEKTVIKLIQEESFQGRNNSKLSTLCSFTDNDGLIRIRTKVSDSQDSESFRYPYVLPSNHPVVKKLIVYEHKLNCHVGIQTMISLLRERFWILKCRKTVKSVISKCTVCQRFTSKPMESIPIGLPEDRVRQAAVFEITGIDLAGPLHLNSGDKVWICLFTCAIYRAVHLELLTSLSTIGFMQALRRFIARRGRPQIIYSDNGTNFVGCENGLKNLDWNEIEKETAITKIEWKFIPPTAAWWGGWWERLIRLMKDILKRILGRACLSYEELNTILCDCEAVLNSRPLTYLSEDADDLAVLTPSMFLQEIREVGIPDLDAVEAKDLKRHQKYRINLRESLKKRFRSEYLGSLKLFAKSQKQMPCLNIGEIVLVMDYNVKRINWPLGKVIDLIPGRDGFSRVARVKTKQGELLRPIQRLCRLELDDKLSPEQIRKVISFKKPLSISEDAVQVTESKDAVLDPNSTNNDDGRLTDDQIPQTVTRSGRKIKKPIRFM